MSTIVTSGTVVL